MIVVEKDRRIWSSSTRTMKIAFARRPSGRYSLAMRQGGRGRGSSRALAAARRVVRWQPRSYLPIWAIAIASYLACVVIFAALGWPHPRGLGFVSAAAGFAGGAVGQSYRLHRRRTA